MLYYYGQLCVYIIDYCNSLTEIDFNLNQKAIASTMSASFKNCKNRINF